MITDDCRYSKIVFPQIIRLALEKIGAWCLQYFKSEGNFHQAILSVSHSSKLDARYWFRNSGTFIFINYIFSLTKFANLSFQKT